MKIACIGMGFVGVVTSAVFAHLGHEVIGLDIDQKRINSLRQGKVPFYEPGLAELLTQTQRVGRLTFTADYQKAITSAEVIIVMVGTPSASDGQADLKFVFAALKSLAPHLAEGAIVVLKSTVPPGTNPQAKAAIRALTQANFDVASVPEFLKEGSAVADTLHPDRILIGSDNKATIAKLIQLHRPLTDNIIVIKPESAQMAKYAANVYLAMRITFANQIADLCEKNGADIEEVLQGIGADRRIGNHYWYPGLGYGGSCFPKDVKEIAAYAKAIGEKESIFIAVDDRNEKRIPRLLRQYDQLVGGFRGKTVGILGLSFKPNTNDTRVAPCLRIIPWLLAQGAQVRATDPQAILPAQTLLSDKVKYFANPYEVAEQAHALFLLTEWEEYLHLDFNKLNKLMLPPKYFFDTRNRYRPVAVTSAGLKYQGVGRG